MDEFDVSDEQPTQTLQNLGIHLPVALLAAAFCVFLFSQISNLSQNRSSMRWQSDNLDRQIVALTESEKNLEGLVKQREALVQQSQQVQSRYTEMLNDLLKLAETDKDAAAVVEKFKVSKQQNAAPQAAEAPTNP
jgi:cell shape-determining protein MreC